MVAGVFAKSVSKSMSLHPQLQLACPRNCAADGSRHESWGSVVNGRLNSEHCRDWCLIGSDGTRPSLHAFVLTRFLDANRFPPPDQVRGHASLENAMKRYSGGSTASSYSFLKRAISSAAGTIPSRLPMP